MTPFVTMRRALSDRHLLGGALGDDSWLAWRVLLIAAMGEPLTDEERAIFAKLTGREREPGERVDELWCVIGRRGGKSRAIAALLVYLATMVDYCAQLVLGERGVVLCLARTQEQSQVELEYVAGIIEAAPILAKMVIRRAADSLTLFNRGATIVIAVRAASFRSVRGLTCVAAVADEIAFWQGEDGSANPDVEILRAVRPTLLTTHGPLLAISSPYARRGELWTTFKRDYGPQGDPRILVAHASSREMNPTLRQADIDREMSSWSEELFVADFEAVLYHGGFFGDLATRLKELAKACRAQGYFVFAPGALIRHIEPHGVMTREIPDWLDPAETLLFAAACIKSGRVKFCPATIDKMAIHPLGAALSFKADDPVEAALQGAFLAAISLKFDHQLSSKPKRRA